MRLTISFADSVVSTGRLRAGICRAASVGISLVTWRAAADGSVAGGPAVSLGSAGRGDAGVGGGLLPGLLSEDPNGGDTPTQSVVDHAGSSGLGPGDSVWTACRVIGQTIISF